MKALTTNGLTKLIQLIKSSFISNTDTVTTNTVTLATVATSGSYNDLSNKPTIPTVGNGTITINQGGTQKGTFTTNQSGNTIINLDAGGGSGGGANFEMLKTPVPRQSAFSDTMNCYIGYTETMDEITGEPVVALDGEIYYEDVISGEYYHYVDGEWNTYPFVPDFYLLVPNFDAKKGMLYRKWTYTNETTGMIETYYTYGELSGDAQGSTSVSCTLDTYDINGKYVGLTDVTLTLSEFMDITVTAYFGNKNLIFSGEVYSSIDENCIISNSDDSIVANIALNRYVVETYTLGKSWYRVYSDGWCEQGGVIGSEGTTRGKTQNISFAKPFRDRNYTIIAVDGNTSKTDYNNSVAIANILNSTKRSTGVSVSLYGFTQNDVHGVVNWVAYGYII